MIYTPDMTKDVTCVAWRCRPTCCSEVWSRAQRTVFRALWWMLRGSAAQDFSKLSTWASVMAVR